jgi:hypothetical protein
MGRADFHGAAINTAARYMEVAAHGGQVSTGDSMHCIAEH